MVIRPSRGWRALDWRELWCYRELLYFLIWRDIKVRYKQTILGGAWAILQPLLTMVVFTIFFGKLAKLSTDGVPPALFYYSALVPWSFFAHGLAYSSNSMVGSANLIRKIYFPRLISPLASVVSGLVDFSIAFGLLLLMLPYFGFSPSPNAVWLPCFLILALLTALGVGLWLSAMNVQFRDVRYAVPFMVQMWLFMTPIAYSVSYVPERWRSLYALNPMVGVVEGFRWALLGTDNAPGIMIFFSTIAALALLVSGAYYFRRMEKTFADVI